VYGYVKNRSTKGNARHHCGAKYLLKADIQSFFPTISLSRAELALRLLDIEPQLSSLLATVFCFPGFLAAGVSGSPLIAIVSRRVVYES
jgi:hypothetical protein